MKSFLIFLLAILLPAITQAQHPVTIRNLWTRPQVHILFGDYTVSFAIKDIDRTLAILREIYDSTSDARCGLDTSKDYSFELYPGMHSEYRYPTQHLIQNVVGCFLLTAGHAVITNKKHKVLKEIIVDIDPLEPGDTKALVSFYDPKNKAMIFQGKMNVGLYKQDLGFDY